MRKKIVVTLFMILMIIGAVACGTPKQSESGKTQVTSVQQIKEFPKFSTKDINDKVVSNDIFKNNKLTLINIWGTFCGPCVEELPYLQEINNEMKDKKIGVIGIVADGDKGDIEAVNILKNKNVTYTNLLPSKELTEGILSKVDAVPVTMFVNDKGERVGEVILGSKSKEDYKKIIEKTLQELK